MSVILKGYVPKPGSDREKILVVLRGNPTADTDAVAKAIGKDRDSTDGILRCMRRAGVLSNINLGRSRIPHRFLVPVGKVEEQVAKELRETIKSVSEIANETNLTNRAVFFVNKERGIRTKLVNQNVLWGLKIEKLDVPVNPLSLAERESILQANLNFILTEIKEFPEEARKILEPIAKSKVLVGLSKYYKELMSQQHFVMLVTRRVVYEYLVEEKRNGH